MNTNVNDMSSYECRTRRVIHKPKKFDAFYDINMFCSRFPNNTINDNSVSDTNKLANNNTRLSNNNIAHQLITKNKKRVTHDTRTQSIQKRQIKPLTGKRAMRTTMKTINTIRNNGNGNGCDRLQVLVNSLRSQLKRVKQCANTRYEKLSKKYDLLESDYRSLETELMLTIGQLDDCKRKRWCNVCLKCATYYCCWNGLYCSTQCQHKHWISGHHNNCQRNKSNK